MYIHVVLTYGNTYLQTHIHRLTEFSEGNTSNPPILNIFFKSCICSPGHAAPQYTLSYRIPLGLSNNAFPTTNNGSQNSTGSYLI